MKRGLLRVGTLVLVMAMAITIYAEENPSADIKGAQEKLESIQSQIDENNREIDKKKRAKRQIEARIGSLAKELRIADYKLRRSRRKLNENKKNVQKTEQNLTQLEQEFNTKKEVFKARITDIYQSQNIGMIEILLSPKGLIENTEARYFADKMIKQDIALIEDIKQKKETLESERKKLEVQKNRIQKIQHDIKKNEAKIQKQKAQKQEYLTVLETEIERSIRENQELQQSSEDLMRFLVQEGKGDDTFYGTGRMIKPTHGWLSSKFGYRRHPISKRRLMHNGIDLAARKGTKIKAADSGVVKIAGYNKKYRGYGKVTVIDHGRRSSDGKRIATVYAHQSRIFVKEGQMVKRGSEIGWVGSTGYSTGPHLHFEVRENGRPVNPLDYIRIK